MKKVFIFGEDQLLLELRAEILRRASFDVKTFMGLGSLSDLGKQERPDLVVLCSFPTKEELARARDVVAEHFASVPLITLLRSGQEFTGSGHFLSMMDGPKGLVRLAKMLADSPAHVLSGLE